MKKITSKTVTVTLKVARKDAEGKRVKEVVDGKKKTVYDEVQKEIKKDAPSRLHARRQDDESFHTRLKKYLQRVPEERKTLKT